jgi:glycosyltransferase involved in cell wall biosynthesis
MIARLPAIVRDYPLVSGAQPITLVGHPFANIGMGEQLRSHMRSLDAVYEDFGVIDVYRFAARTEPNYVNLVGHREVNELPDGVRIFHINGDEIEPVLGALKSRRMRFSSGVNVLVPAWELPVYPEIWVEPVRLFDEVWAVSRFVQQSLADAGIESHHVGQSVEIASQPFLSRKYFGISESAFVFLHFFDLSSYASRKNPEAVLEMYRCLRERRPFDDIQLVMKVKKGDETATEWIDYLRQEFADVVFIANPLSHLEIASLIANCDCFVTLHRAEGFGRGAGEAMFLGRLALATGWSGNMDYMDEENALLVKYELRPVADGAYPHGAGQLWAEPEVEHAVHLAIKALDDPSYVRRLEMAARRAVFSRAGNRAVGIRIAERLAAFE